MPLALAPPENGKQLIWLRLHSHSTGKAIQKEKSKKSLLKLNNFSGSKKHFLDQEQTLLSQNADLSLVLGCSDHQTNVFQSNKTVLCEIQSSHKDRGGPGRYPQLSSLLYPWNLSDFEKRQQYSDSGVGVAILVTVSLLDPRILLEFEKC